MGSSPLVVVDTDISLGTPRAEIDDGAALIALLRSGVDVRCIGTVHGNVPVADATHNLRRLLAYLRREEIPIGLGSALPLVQDPLWFAGWQDGYGPTPPWPDEPELPAAASLLIDTIRAHPGQVVILALGPLTNLALAARLAPDIIPNVREVIAMGGSFGEATIAEFNTRCDPEAFHIVTQAAWPIRILGLDITRRIHFERERFTQLSEQDAALRLLKQQAPGWIARVEMQGWDHGGCGLHDAAAVAALLDDTLFNFVDATLSVELHHPKQRGVTTIQRAAQATNVRVAIDVDSARCGDLIWSCLQQPLTKG